MLRFLLLVAAALSFIVTEINSNQIRPSTSSHKIHLRIFGGKVARRDQFPYQVGFDIPVNKYERQPCGGSLISQRFVLTAAHCFFDDEGQLTSRNFTAYFGNFKKFSIHEEGHIHLEIPNGNLIVHPLFNLTTVLNDIALVKTPEEIILTRYIQVISLPPVNLSPLSLIGQNITSSGWGRIGDNNQTRVLRFMVTKIVFSQECFDPDNDFFRNDRQICINDPYKSICSGDSGGPNIITTPEGRKILIGISSYLAYNFTCEIGIPQVLTHVSFYLPWIHNHTGIPI